MACTQITLYIRSINCYIYIYFNLLTTGLFPEQLEYQQKITTAFMKAI